MRLVWTRGTGLGVGDEGSGTRGRERACGQEGWVLASTGLEAGGVEPAVAQVAAEHEAAVVAAPAMAAAQADT